MTAQDKDDSTPWDAQIWEVEGHLMTGRAFGKLVQSANVKQTTAYNVEVGDIIGIKGRFYTRVM